MSLTHPRPRAAVAALFCVGASLLATGPAHAAPQQPTGTIQTLTLHYPVTATTVLGTSGAVIAVGPSTISATILTQDLSRKKIPYTAVLPLPATPASIPVLGGVDLGGDVLFRQLGPLTGTLSPVPGTAGLGTLTSAGSYELTVRNVTLDGKPYAVGLACHTIEPVYIAVKNPPGQLFGLISGGVATGSYVIGDFTGCGKATGLINLVTPGRHNTLTLTLGPAT